MAAEAAAEEDLVIGDRGGSQWLVARDGHAPAGLAFLALEGFGRLGGHGPLIALLKVWLNRDTVLRRLLLRQLLEILLDQLELILAELLDLRPAIPGDEPRVEDFGRHLLLGGRGWVLCRGGR